LIRWEDDPQPGWYDTESGDLIDESELVERYHDNVVERTGIREFVDDGAIDPDHASVAGVGVPGQGLLFRGVVGGRCARLAEFDPNTRVRRRPIGAHWQVTRKAARDPVRKDQAVADVGAQIPTGFDPTGGESARTMAVLSTECLWNIVADSRRVPVRGFQPAEVMRYVHPSLVASTPGHGMGGMTSMQTCTTGTCLAVTKPNTSCRKCWPNVVAAHSGSVLRRAATADDPPGCRRATAAVSSRRASTRSGSARLSWW